MEAQAIAAYLRELGASEVIWGKYPAPDLREQVKQGGFDLLIALGGDGTMLRAGHLAAVTGLPLLGINMGAFGFLMEVQPNEWRELLPVLLRGEYRLEERMLLRAKHLRGEQNLGEWDVINEVAVTRGHSVRPVRMQAYVDGYPLAAYVADGLIASTATGSSAYALAAGGPIMPPEMRNILIVPVAPHLSLNRAVILPEGACVSIRVATSHEAVFSVDGQPPIPVLDGDTVRVSANSNGLRFVRFRDPGYFYSKMMQYMEQNPSAGEWK